MRGCGEMGRERLGVVTGEKEPDGSEIIFPSSFWQTAGRRIRARNNSVGKFSISTHTTTTTNPVLFLPLAPGALPRARFPLARSRPSSSADPLRRIPSISSRSSSRLGGGAARQRHYYRYYPSLSSPSRKPSSHGCSRNPRGIYRPRIPNGEE